MSRYLGQLVDIRTCDCGKKFTDMEAAREHAQDCDEMVLP